MWFLSAKIILFNRKRIGRHSWSIRARAQYVVLQAQVSPPSKLKSFHVVHSCGVSTWRPPQVSVLIFNLQEAAALFDIRYRNVRDSVILTQKNSRVDHFNSRLTMTRNAICNNAMGIHFLCRWGGREISKKKDKRKYVVKVNGKLIETLRFDFITDNSFIILSGCLPFLLFTPTQIYIYLLTKNGTILTFYIFI